MLRACQPYSEYTQSCIILQALPGSPVADPVPVTTSSRLRGHFGADVIPLARTVRLRSRVTLPVERTRGAALTGRTLGVQNLLE